MHKTVWNQIAIFPKIKRKSEKSKQVKKIKRFPPSFDQLFSLVAQSFMFLIVKLSNIKLQVSKIKRKLVNSGHFVQRDLLVRINPIKRLIFTVSSILTCQLHFYGHTFVQQGLGPVMSHSEQVLRNWVGRGYLGAVMGSMWLLRGLRGCYSVYVLLFLFK